MLLLQKRRFIACYLQNTDMFLNAILEEYSATITQKL